MQSYLDTPGVIYPFPDEGAYEKLFDLNRRIITLSNTMMAMMEKLEEKKVGTKRFRAVLEKDGAFDATETDEGKVGNYGTKSDAKEDDFESEEADEDSEATY
jgi:hypothetical protein